MTTSPRAVLVRLAVAVAILSSLPTVAHADPRFGVRFGYYTEAEGPFLGAEMLFRIIPPEIYFNPNVEAVLVDDGHYFTINADFHYDFLSGRRTFWLGTGLAILNTDPGGSADSDTDFGLNLLAGIGTRRGRVIPYAQAKLILKSDTEFVIGVGLRF